MSKLSFRARALDASKALPIYRDTEIPDTADCSNINRTVPQMPTGMEKEEESVRQSKLLEFRHKYNSSAAILFCHVPLRASLSSEGEVSVRRMSV